MLRKIRIILATVMMTLITLLLLDFTGTVHHWMGWVAKIQFLPAVLALNVVVVAALVLLTLVFGRIYCSVICPLGIMQDLLSSMNRKKNHFSYSPEKRWLRYGVLAVFLAALAAGVGAIVALLAPYSAYGRIVTGLLQPLYIWGNNGLAAIAEHYDTVLSWLARFSWFKVYIDTDKCRNCSLCSKNCKASCIDYRNHRVDYSRCVTCGNCLEKCEFGALRYGRPMKQPATQPAPDQQPDTARRAFLVGGSIVAADAALAQAGKKVDGGLAVIIDKKQPKRTTPITPPGSISAANMARHCTACQLCVAQCPNDVLRPSTDLKTFMQPVMSYERGYCRPECHHCSQVCPSGAIRPIGHAAKASTQIGHAVWIKDNCVVLTDGVSCGNCARHCPSGAIMMVPLDPDDDTSPMVPAVDRSRCIGCGACEYVCPARPFSAIYVEGHEQHQEI